MNKVCPSAAITCGLALCAALCPAHSGAQARSASSARPSAASAQASSAAQDDPLANDPRLKTRVTFRRLLNMAELLRALNAQTGVKMMTEDVELGLTHVACAYENTPLRDILDGLSRVGNFAWMRRGDGVLVLQHGYDASRFDIFRPHTDAEAEIWRLGRKFLDDYNKLPQSAKDTMLGKHYEPGEPGPRPGMDFGQLPPGAQDLMRSMLQARQQDLASRGESSALDPAHLSDTYIVMHPVNHQSGLDDYTVSIMGKGYDTLVPNSKHTMHTYGESQQMQFIIFDDPRDNVIRVTSPHGSAPHLLWNGAREDARTRRENGTSEARLNKRVTLTSHRYTPYDALLEMHTQTGIDFALPASVKYPDAPFFACTDMPLKDALDALCKTYIAAYFPGESGLFTWSARKSGVVLLHATPRWMIGPPAVFSEAAHP